MEDNILFLSPDELEMHLKTTALIIYMILSEIGIIIFASEIFNIITTVDQEKFVMEKISIFNADMNALECIQSDDTDRLMRGGHKALYY